MAEAPGEHEIIQEIPLCGATGVRLQNDILSPLGLEREDVLFDNLIRCRPYGNSFPIGNTAVNMIRHCRQYDTPIDTFNPTVVILAFHPTFALIRTNQAYSTWNAVAKAIALYEAGERPLIAMGAEIMNILFPTLPGSITKWDGKHFFVKWPKGLSHTQSAYDQALQERAAKTKMSFKEFIQSAKPWEADDDVPF